jgi:predicted metal-dependent peptidase
MLKKTEELSATDKIISARIKLLLSQPFFGNIVSRLELVETTQFPTGATDGYKLYYNPDFINKLTSAEVLFFVAHEACHIIFLYWERQNDRISQMWNAASDYAANDILKVNKIGKLVDDCLWSEKYKNSYSEEIYDDLQKNAPKNAAAYDKFLKDLASKILDTHIPMGQDGEGNQRSQEEIESLINQIKQDIISGIQSCDSGNRPQGIDRIVGSITNPQLCWQEVIRQKCKSKIRNDFTFMRPSKRSFHTGVYLPSMHVEDHIDICIAFDVSGSIGDDLISLFKSEIFGIISDFKSWNIKMWSFDTKVYNVKDYSSDGDSSVLEYEPQGGGGTDFECNWEYMKKHEIDPKLFIMFTDLYPYGGWGDPNYCDTIFVGYHNKTTIAPFGETIHL